MLTVAGIPYRIVGGMAVYIHVYERDPIRARLTSDVDAAIERKVLPLVIEAAKKAGWVYKHSAGLDMLADSMQLRSRSAIHLLFLNEKVRPDYTESVPSSPAERSSEGILWPP
jgi:hypothetical protein